MLLVSRPRTPGPRHALRAIAGTSVLIIAAPAARALADITALADTTVPIDFAVSGFAPSRLLCARVSRNPPYAGVGVFRSP